MSEEEQNPDEPTLKQKTEVSVINSNVTGSNNSKVGTITAVGVNYEAETSARKRMAGGKLNPDEPPRKRSKESHTNVIGATYSTAETVIAANEIHGGVHVHSDKRKDKLIESTKKRIQVFTEGMIRVSTVDKILEKLTSGQGWITITGSAGDGKTTLAYLVLKELMDMQPVYEIKTPEDYHQISEMEENRIIFLNDIFGAFTFDPSSTKEWTDVIRDIFDVQMKRQDCVTQVVFVSRKNILKHVKKLLEQYGKNIIDKKYSFDISQVVEKEERIQILDFHLDKRGITSVSDETKWGVAEIGAPHGFPHSCKMFADLVERRQDIDIYEFFKTPLKFLDDTTEVLFEEECEDLFIVLVKMNGEFDPSNVENEKERRNLNRVALGQEGSYLRKNEAGVWEFSHPSIYESVLNVEAAVDPLLVVKYASMSAILQKVRLKEPGSDTTTCFILLEPSKAVVHGLAERFLNCPFSPSDIFAHRLSSNKEFCDHLISKLTQTEDMSTDHNNRSGMWGATLLEQASFIPNNTAVKSLLEHGADPNVGYSIGNILHYLLDENNEEIDFDRMYYDTMKLLIEAGADVNSVDDDGMTPLHLLLRCYRYISKICQLLIERGANVNLVDEKGNTPLHCLCSNFIEIDEYNLEDISDDEEGVEALHLLIRSGADVNLRNRNGETAFDILFKYRHTLCTFASVKALLVLGYDLNHLDEEGKTLLHHICSNDGIMVNSIKLLITDTIDVNIVDKGGKTALHHLCANEGVSVDTLKLLITVIADVNIVDEDGKTALHHLCANEGVSVDTLKLLITVIADVNIVDEDGNTALHHLCANEGVCVDTLKLLITVIADVNIVDKDGKTALHCLCAHEDASVDTFKLLFIKNINGNIVDKDGRTALHYLCAHRNVSVDTLKVLIMVENIDVNIVDKDGKTALHYLCAQLTDEQLELLINSGLNKEKVNKKSLHYVCSNASVMDILIKNGAHINEVDEEVKTPLHHLCGNEGVSDELLEMLIKNGAKVNEVDAEGKTPLHHLCSNRRISVGKTLLHHICSNDDIMVNGLKRLITETIDVNIVDKGGKTALHYLCANWSLSADTLHLLIKENIDVNRVDAEVKTPLHHLCGNISVSDKTLEMLIKNGAKVNGVDTEGKTPLHNLCGNRSVSDKTLEMLIKNGAKVNDVDAEGKTPLHHLCSDPDPGRTIPNYMYINWTLGVDTLKVLMAENIDVNKVDAEGKTPLHLLCSNRERSVVTLTLLVKSGAKVNEVDIGGRTPLHYLCKTAPGSVYELVVFIENGAEINKVDNEGKSALHVLCENGEFDKSYVEVLFKDGADVNMVDHEGNTPLHYLCGRNYESIYRTLCFLDTLRFLIRKVVDVNWRNGARKRPLDILTERHPGFHEAIECFKKP